MKGEALPELSNYFASERHVPSATAYSATIRSSTPLDRYDPAAEAAARICWSIRRIGCSCSACGWQGGAPFWCTAGGAVGPGEDYSAAARREIAREAGLDLECGPGIRAAAGCPSSPVEGEPVGADGRYFLVRASASAVPPHSGRPYRVGAAGDARMALVRRGRAGDASGGLLSARPCRDAGGGPASGRTNPKLPCRARPRRPKCPAVMADPIIIAVPKGRILEEALPLLERAGIVPEAAFSDPDSRALRFATNRPDIALIRVRAFDVATFVAHGSGAARPRRLRRADGVRLFGDLRAGRPQYRPLPRVRGRAGRDGGGRRSARVEPCARRHRNIRTSPSAISRRAACRAECVKLNGAVEIAPVLELAGRIVDLVSSGRTLKENGLVEVEVIAEVSTRLIVNRAAFKTRAGVVGPLIEAFRRAVEDARCGLADPAAGCARCRLRGRVRRAGGCAARGGRGRLARRDPHRGGRARQWRGGAAPLPAAVRPARSGRRRLGHPSKSGRRRWRGLDPDLRGALELAAARIRAYHEKQKPADTRLPWPRPACAWGARWRGVDAARALCAGRAGGLSVLRADERDSARVAGVSRLAMVTPTPGGVINPTVLAAAGDRGRGRGVARGRGAGGGGAGLWRGADQAGGRDRRAGQCLGRRSQAPALRRGRHRHGGRPVEIVVVADGANDPSGSPPTCSARPSMIRRASRSCLPTMPALPTGWRRLWRGRSRASPPGETARTSWSANGAIVLVPALADALPLVDRLAPEHLELAVADPEPLFAQVRHAGSVFLGRHTPEAVGDYRQAAQITCCRPGGGRVSPRAFRCWIS